MAIEVGQSWLARRGVDMSGTREDLFEHESSEHQGRDHLAE